MRLASVVLWLTALVLSLGALCSPATAAGSGDFDGSGRLDARDAIATLQAVAGLRTATAEEVSRGDVNGNGRLDVQDVLVILQILAGLRPPPTPTPEGPVGTWLHVRDSDGTVPGQGSIVTLRLDEGGHATITATNPSFESMVIEGTYALAQGLADLEFPDFGISVKKGAYTLQGDDLTLPFLLFNEGQGTSTWKRLAPVEMDRVFGRFHDSLRKGRSLRDAVGDAADEARKLPGVTGVYVPTVTPPPPPQEPPGPDGNPKPPLPEPNTTPNVIEIEYGDVRHHVVLWSKTSTPAPPVPKPIPLAPLASDPRIHLAIQNPEGDPDLVAPKSALIISPFHTSPYFALSASVINDPAPRPLDIVGRAASFKDGGEDLTYIKNQLRKAGVEDITSLVDAQATPGAIYRALQERSYGVIYFPSHGGTDKEGRVGVVSGGYLGDFRDRPGTVAEANRRLKLMLERENVPLDAIARDGVTIAWVDIHNGMAYAFPLLWPPFFESALRGKDYSRSLVYIDSCFSAATTSLAKLFKPRVYLGNTVTCTFYSSAQAAKHIFTTMARSNRTVREAWDRVHDVTEAGMATLPEDDLLASTDTLDMRKECSILQAYGDLQEPYKRIGDTIHWLLFMGRWTEQDINQGGDSLQRCCDNWWEDEKRPGLADQYCNQGILGSHYPTPEEVEEARYLLTGRPWGPYGGRLVFK